MGIRLGEILVSRGVLKDWQRREILATQARTSRPFGVLAEDLFGVEPFEIEQAWAAQYAQITGFVDIESCQQDPQVLSIINGRQAWQFGLVPMRFEGNELVFLTTQASLPRAIRFAGWAIGHICAFKLARDDDFAELIQSCYAMPGGEQLFDKVIRRTA